MCSAHAPRGMKAVKTIRAPVLHGLSLDHAAKKCQLNMIHLTIQSLHLSATSITCRTHTSQTPHHLSGPQVSLVCLLMHMHQFICMLCQTKPPPDNHQRPGNCGLIAPTIHFRPVCLSGAQMSPPLIQICPSRFLTAGHRA